MNRIAKIAVGAGAAILAAGIILPILYRQRDGRVGRIVRNNPLKNPEYVFSIDGITLTTSERTIKLAGVMQPKNVMEKARLEIFIRIATKGGVELDRTLPGGSTGMLRCEVRVQHGCGLDPVRAHYAQFNLSELAVALRYAKFDLTAQGLTEVERTRMQEATELGEFYDVLNTSNNVSFGINHGEFYLSIASALNSKLAGGK